MNKSKTFVCTKLSLVLTRNGVIETFTGCKLLSLSLERERERAKHRKYYFLQ